MSDIKNTEAEVVSSLAAAGLETRKVDDTPFVLLPEGFQAHSLEGFLSSPSRIRQHVTLADTASFLAYWHKFVGLDSTVFCGTHEHPHFVAIFDYHESAIEPAHGDHTATYKCEFSPEWTTWRGSNEKKHSQLAFAEFIEDNIADIVQPEDEPDAPSGAQMLELAKNFSIKRNVEFESAQRLDNGQVQLTYYETIRGSEKTGQLQIPQHFFIAVAPFLGDQPYKVKARLRYRQDDASLVLWYALYRLDRVLRDAYDHLRGAIAEATSRDVLMGKA